jgi:hypothetical protein
LSKHMINIYIISIIICSRYQQSEQPSLTWINWSQNIWRWKFRSRYDNMAGLNR